MIYYKLYLWWLCKVSTWLGWTACPRIPVSVCFCLRWARGKILTADEEGGSSSRALAPPHGGSSHHTGVRRWPGLQLFGLPLALPSASQIPAAREQAVATAPDTIIRALCCLRVGNKSHKSQGPATSGKCLGVQSEVCWGTLSDPFTEWPRSYQWRVGPRTRESSIGSPDCCANSSATWTIQSRRFNGTRNVSDW